MKKLVLFLSLTFCAFTMNANELSSDTDPCRTYAQTAAALENAHDGGTYNDVVMGGLEAYYYGACQAADGEILLPVFID